MLADVLSLLLAAAPAAATPDRAAPAPVDTELSDSGPNDIPHCGEPASSLTAMQERIGNRPTEPELNLFGRELQPEDGARCNGVQYFALVQVYAQYALFGRTADAARIGEVILRFREKAFADDPSPANSLEVARAKLQLAQTRMKLGEIEAYRDVLTDTLAKSQVNPNDMQYRVNLANLAQVAMTMGEYASARDLAMRGLSLAASDLGPGGYAPDETPAQVQTSERCTATFVEQGAVIQRIVAKPAGTPAGPTDEADLSAAQAKLSPCYAEQIAETSRGLIRSNHSQNLRTLADSLLALGDDAAAERVLRQLVTAPRDYGENSGQAELDLAKLLNRKGAADWRTYAEAARRKAKRDAGIRDPMASWTGQTLPFEQVVGDRNKAGLTSYVLQRAGETELLLGRPAVALTFFDGAEPATSSALLRDGLVSPRTRLLKGLALLADGRPAQAVPFLEDASRDFDAFTPTSRDARSMAMNRNEGALDAHLALLEAALVAGDAEAADRALLRAGRSQLSRSLAGGALRGSGDTAAVDALEAARLATQEDHALVSAVARGAPERELQRLAQSAATLHRMAAAKTDQAARSQPKLQLFGLAPITTTAAIRAQLPANAAILIYAVGSQRGYAALLTRDHLQIERLAPGRNALAAAVGRLRASTEFRVTARGAVTRPFAQSDAEALYRALVTPFAARLGTLNRLYISRTAPLDGLPFAALRDPVSRKWLIDQAALSLVLDPSALTHAPATPRGARPSVLAIGDPRVTVRGLFRDLTIDGTKPFTPAPVRPAAAAAGQSLPGAVAELTAIITAAGGRSLVLAGPQATEARFRAEAIKSYDIIAIASHAVTESVTYKSPRPAIVFTPDAARVAANDGLLHPDEIEGLAIKADTIILSACETASGNGQPGAEALSGLAQAFLYAGSRTVFATQWKVESLSAATLMALTASTMTSLPDASERLRRSMRTLRGRQGYTHPAYWAPFVVVERALS
ncbi:hypothetical protein NSE01_24050 [Novosphingobium sediminis]|uniref:CHAT domain-containing protein n=1 Tax=Novosphingobium sediminis TaxID=707214 RepID=A0A512ALI7_9SPHN|nr:CHAT domain-containing protein [Novosphingobium sediminis]GEO00573.1 hypothetical protein NSE01_24050 [Novosphingobium sediminis]